MSLVVHLFHHWQRFGPGADHESPTLPRYLLIDQYLKLRLRGSELNFVAAFRDFELQNPHQASSFLQELSAGAVAEFAKNLGTVNSVRDLAFAYFRPGAISVS